MTIRTREQAARSAEASKTNTPGRCQEWTHLLYGAPSAGDVDHDGDADAVDGWKSEPVSARHTDRNPPRGVPVAYSGGSDGYGHRAISLGGGKIRSTDAGGRGKVATVDLDWPERQWGLKWLGWSETIDGQPIPGDTPPPTPTPKPPSGIALRVDGVDLSHHNTPVTAARLAEAKNAGVRFVSHKATEGATVKDPTYAARRAMAKKAGLLWGAYHFARPSGGAADALAEAKHFLAVANPAPGDMRCMLDLEDDGGLSRKALTAWVGVFVAEVKRVTGALPYIYTPFDLDDSFGCMLWVARYSNTNAAPRIPAPWKVARIRQFSDGVYGVPNSVAGLGHVDLNTFTGDETDLGWHTLREVAKPMPTPKPSEPLTWVSRHANVQGTDPDHVVTTMVDRLAAGASILRLNELHTKAQQAYRPRGYVGRTAGQLAVLWDDELWREVRHDYVRANRGIAHVTPERGILCVLLAHRATGKRHWEQVTHVVQHIDVGGRPRIRGAITGQNARARHHFRLLAASILAHAKSAPLHGSGDLNVDYLAERRRVARGLALTPWFPLSTLRAVSRIVMPRKGRTYVGTHGARAIDWSWRRGRIKVTRCTILPRGTSDHNAITYVVEQP